MATAQRLKDRKKKVYFQSPQTNCEDEVEDIGSQNYEHTQQKQSEYEQYYQICESNPVGFQPSMTLFPNSHSLNHSMGLPLGFSFPCMLCLENEGCPFMEKTGDKIPRCEHCRSFMNCYNRVENKKYICFLCGNENFFPKSYKPSKANEELNSPIYQCLSPDHVYPGSPPEDCLVFLIDISPDAAHCRMLYYLAQVVKQVLASEQWDETIICVFTYDEILQEYDFSGEEIKCMIMDQTIQLVNVKREWKTLKQIRTQLFELFDSFEEISQNNPRRGSNFSHAFNFSFFQTNQMSPRIFIFQANEALGGEPLFSESVPKAGDPNNPVQAKSCYEPLNKDFINKYVQIMSDSCVSMNIYCFQKGFKNLKILSDTLKLTGSILKSYAKDEAEDLNRFYYEFSAHLSAVTFRNVRTEFLISHGYHFTSIFSGQIRLKQEKGICFYQTTCDPSKRVSVIFNPASDLQVLPLPYIACQIASNYRYRRQDFFCVSTVVFPVTGYLERLYSSIESIEVISIITKSFMANIRTEHMNIAKKKLTDVATIIWKRALEFFKHEKNVCREIRELIQATLGMLKSMFSQFEYVKLSPIADKLIADRLFLTSSASHEINCFFRPYLFSLGDMEEGMCRDDIDFVYPNTVEPRFRNIKQGLFLLDNGLGLYLFITKKCSQEIIKELFGKPKLTKNDVLTEQMIAEGTSYLAYQINVLVKVLREQKVNGWVPLRIVRCGQNSIHQKNFYLSFFNENYEEFKTYRASYQEYINILTRSPEMR